MKKTEVLKRIRDIGVIPIVRASSAEEAIHVVEAIKAGGLPILEIAMTVPGAVQVIEQLRQLKLWRRGMPAPTLSKFFRRGPWAGPVTSSRSKLRFRKSN